MMHLAPHNRHFLFRTSFSKNTESKSLKQALRVKKMIAFSLALLAATGVSFAQSAVRPEGLQEERKEAKALKPTFGIKAGYNVAKLTGRTPDYRPASQNGFMVAASFAPASKAGIGYRSELVFSRQGFGFDQDGKQTTVVSDYLYLPQFTTIGITKFLQLQVGAQFGYLLKSSTKESLTASKDLTSWANRIDYGAAFGAELYPLKNLIIGGRYNMSFGSAYKKISTSDASPIPNPLPFNPSDVKSRNAVLNFFVGVRL